MSIIVLRGADFSQNNIGKIDLPIPFNGFTIRALELNNIVINEEDGFQKRVNSFFQFLLDSEIIGSENAPLKSLALPFLSLVSGDGATSLAQQNVLNGANFFTTDIEGSLSVVDKGFKVVEGGVSTKMNLVDYVDASSFHVAGYNITDVIPYEPKASEFITGQCGVHYGLQKNRSTSDSPAGYLTGPNALYGDSNYAIIPCLLVLNATTDRCSLITNGQITQQSPATYAGTSLSNPFMFTYRQSVYTTIPDNANGAIATASYSLLSGGKAMSDEQSISYNNAVNELMIAVNTYL